MNQYIWGNEKTQFFYQLNPDTILAAVETLGLKTTGRCFALNSMENRVYEIEIESDGPDPQDHFIIAKFYRPGRWTKEQILEEHSFLMELEAAEIPVIAPIAVHEETLFQVQGQPLYFCIFKKQGGRSPHDMDEVLLQMLGRLLARIHSVGAAKKALHRLQITPDTFGRSNLAFLLESKSIPAAYEEMYRDKVEMICSLSDPLFQGIETHRIHGDCHWGNVIHREGKGIFFIDFDDMLTGPAVQDVWLLVPGEDEYAASDRSILIEAYETMRNFDHGSLKLIEPLRALRMIHFSAWIAKRWEDPSFQRAFPFFGSNEYWTTQIKDLSLQLEKIQSLTSESAIEPFDRWS